MRRALLILLVLAAAAGTLKGVLSWPDAGTSDFPPRVHVSPRYLERSALETGRSNPVSAVLWDYRAFDLWFWIFTALAAWATFTTIRPADPDKKGRFAYPVGNMAIWVLVGCAFLAWALGVVPAWQGGFFLDYETLPLPVEAAHARAFAATILQVLVLLVLAAFLAAAFRKSGPARRDRE